MTKKPRRTMDSEFITRVMDGEENDEVRCLFSTNEKGEGK